MKGGAITEKNKRKLITRNRNTRLKTNRLQRVKPLSVHFSRVKETKMDSQIISVKEKIGYGMGDAASHIVFDNVMLYMMFFYTDIFGIPAGDRKSVV